jgi:phosphoglycerate dehydrogenase-like enzyme
MLKGVYIMHSAEWPKVYPPPVQAQLNGLVEILGPVLSAAEALERSDLLCKVDVVFSGWGGPMMDAGFLALAPKLQAVFYAAGAVRHLLSEAFWERKIAITTANAANAIPVSEFTLAHILLGLKRALVQAAETKRQRSFVRQPLPIAGAFQSRVGLISLSTIGRLVRQRLEPFDLYISAYDPTVAKEEADALDIDLVSLPKLFTCSDVVSLHAPLIPQTRGMITGELLASMKPGATFINTSQGGVVRESEMIEVLRARPDLTAVLDVTDPEPPMRTCALFDLPNVILTPHIAGSIDGECARMGQWMVNELRRYLRSETLVGQIGPEPKIVRSPHMMVVPTG